MRERERETGTHLAPRQFDHTCCYYISLILDNFTFFNFPCDVITPSVYPCHFSRITQLLSNQTESQKTSSNLKSKYHLLEFGITCPLTYLYIGVICIQFYPLRFWMPFKTHKMCSMYSSALARQCSPSGWQWPPPLRGCCASAKLNNQSCVRISNSAFLRF